MENNNNTYDNIILTLDRILERQDRMIEKMNGIIDTMREMNDDISSKRINDEASVSMRERWDTTGPR